MNTTSFADRLFEAVRKKHTSAMVGIDPTFQAAEFPSKILRPQESERRTTIDLWREFCVRIINLAAERVAVVKFQMACFESQGPAGIELLERLAVYAASAGLIVIFDGKRNDIGNTAAMYARAYLANESRWRCDALTINPYLGEEGLTPFVDTAYQNGTGVFVLVRTSNPGAGRLQDATVDGRRVYSIVADWTREAAERTKRESRYSPVGAVVGATAPQQLADIRKQLPHSILLIPGFGAQGGTAKDCAPAFDENGLGALVNNSRGILYAWKQPEYAGMHWLDASRKALDRMIMELRAVAPVR